MSFSYQRRYQGPLRAAILDWAGTVVDHGCLAPPATFVEAFAASGVAITVAEARAPMGMAKREHIRAIIEAPRVAAAWTDFHGRPPTTEDVDRLYAEFLPLQTATVARYAGLIGGALGAVEAMRGRGLRIGSTTGYPRSVMAVVSRHAAEQGYVADCVVAAEDAPIGRPSPFPALQALITLGVYPVEAAVKIGDTIVDVEEGLNGGMWSVAVAVTGNEVGLSAEAWDGLPAPQQSRLRDRAAARLRAAGAHYVIDRLADVGPVLDDIEARLKRGEKP
jgi:phosphonoacetaldehyde hydrolase